MDEFVFHDPTGRRARRANLGVGLLVALAALIVAAFFATLAFTPHLPTLTLKDPQVLQALHVETAHRFRRPAGWRSVRRPARAAAGGPARPLSRRLLRELGWKIPTRFAAPEWMNSLDVVSPLVADYLGRPSGRVTVTSDPFAEALIAGAKTPPSVLPMVHNGHNGANDGPLADSMLVYPAAQDALDQQPRDLGETARLGRLCV